MSSCFRSDDAGLEVSAKLLAVQVTADEDQLVGALLAGLPWLPKPIGAGPKRQQHVHPLEEVPAHSEHACQTDGPVQWGKKNKQLHHSNHHGSFDVRQAERPIAHISSTNTT